MVKRVTGFEDWIVYHHTRGSGRGLGLNETSSEFTSSAYWDSTDPTDSEFTVGTHNRVNTSGHTYVAYLFAHDDQRFGTGSDASHY